MNPRSLPHATRAFANSLHAAISLLTDISTNLAVLVIAFSVMLTACSKPGGEQKANDSRQDSETAATARARSPFTYPKAVWTESLIPVGTPTHLWRERANEDSSAGSFLFADKKSVHLVIVSFDGRIVHQDTFAGIIEFNSENFRGVSGYHGLQYEDEKTNRARMDLETMPGSRWLVWHDIMVSDAGKAWMYSVYTGGKWEVVSGNDKVGSSDTVPIMSLSKSGAAYRRCRQRTNRRASSAHLE